jgi:hypothetical protein
MINLGRLCLVYSSRRIPMHHVIGLILGGSPSRSYCGLWWPAIRLPVSRPLSFIMLLDPSKTPQNPLESCSQPHFPPFPQFQAWLARVSGLVFGGSDSRCISLDFSTTPWRILRRPFWLELRTSRQVYVAMAVLNAAIAGGPRTMS